MSYSYFQTNVFAKFFDIICIFIYTHSPYFMCHCAKYKLSPLQVTISEENKLNTTTQQFITTKILGLALKQMSKTHSSQRQSNFQLQNETALYCIMSNTSSRAQCAAELAGAHYGLQDRIFLNYTTIENEHKVAYARKLSIFRCV